MNCASIREGDEEQLKNVNVVGTKTLLELAADVGNCGGFLQLSSVGVGGSSTSNTVVTETSAALPLADIPNQFDQSKAAAESMVNVASANGLRNATIIRLGSVSPPVGGKLVHLVRIALL